MIMVRVCVWMAAVHSGLSYDMYIYCPQCSFIVQLSIFQIYSENWFMLIQFVQFNTNTVQYMFDCMFTLCIWTVCKYTECFIGHSSLMTVTVQNVQYMHLIMYMANVIMDWYCSSCCYAVYTLWCLDSYQSECVRSSVVNGCLLCTMQCTTSW